MLDRDVRPALSGYMLEALPGARVVPELGIHGGFVLADMVAVGHDAMHGYEIKADTDSLKRLPRQMVSYATVFDRCTLVGAPRHVRRASTMLPPWWGLVTATMVDGVTSLAVTRQAGPNPVPTSLRVLLRMAWADELMAVAEANGWARGVRGKGAGVVAERIMSRATPCEVRALVRHLLRVRRWDRRVVADLGDASGG